MVQPVLAWHFLYTIHPGKPSSLPQCAQAYEYTTFHFPTSVFMKQ